MTLCFCALPPLGGGFSSQLPVDSFWLSEAALLKEVLWGAQESCSERSPEVFFQKRGCVREFEAAKGKKCVKQKRTAARLVLWDDIRMHESPFFNARRKRTNSVPIWVKLPGLLLDFWSLDIFKEIGNTLGTFLEAEQGFVDSNSLSVARILVSLDLREGLAKEILIQKGGFSHSQLLDYMGIPFRCRRCHKYGHLAMDCSLSFSNKVWVKKSEVEGQGFQRDMNDQMMSSGVLPPVDISINPNVILWNEVSFSGGEKEVPVQIISLDAFPLSELPTLLETQEIIYSKSENKENLPSQTLLSKAEVDGLTNPSKGKSSSGVLTPVDNPTNPSDLLRKDDSFLVGSKEVLVQPTSLDSLHLSKSSSLLETRETCYSKSENKDFLFSQILLSQAEVDGLFNPVWFIQRGDSASKVEQEGTVQFFSKGILSTAKEPCFIEPQEEVLVISESKVSRCSLEVNPRYLLRPRSRGSGSLLSEVEGGLGSGVIKGFPGSGSGRKSNLALAQSKAKKEILSELGSTSRKQALGRLVDVHKPDVLFLQEMLGEGLSLVRDLKKNLKEWDFIALDAAQFCFLKSWANPYPLSSYFLKKLEVVGLVDAEPVKFPPTWRKLRVGEASIAKRLDRFLLDDSLVTDQFRIRQWVEVGGDFDHFPFFLELAYPGRKPPSPFKFNSAWLGEEAFKQKLKDIWVTFDESSRESASIQFAANLKRLKQVAADWAHRKKLKNDQELVSIKEDLEVLYRFCTAGYPDEETKCKVQSLEHKRRKLIEEKEKNVNTVWKIHGLNGTIASGFDKLSQLGVDHLKGLYKEENKTTIAEVIKMTSFFPSFVGEEDNVSLTKEITVDELKEVMLSLQKDKSLGPDGWTIEFFLGYFDFIETNLLRVIEELRSSAKMLAAVNSTFKALIPKTDNPVFFEDFRPISLCNCMYKILTKLLAMRIKKVLSFSISKEQFSFLQGRQIHEAIGVAQEGLHTIKTKRLKALVVKLDLSKAYDRASWLYLRLMLLHLGFFRPGRGLRQGCPLSPLLFLLVAEGLSRALGEAKITGQLKGIKIGGSTYLTHLLFVDDILLFCEGSRRDIMKLKEILDLYCAATVMMINLNKSSISFSQVLEEDRGFMNQLFPFHQTDLNAGLNEKEGIPLVKWQTMATPKSLGGWGLKNIHLFGRASAAKSVWRLISSEADAHNLRIREEEWKLYIASLKRSYVRIKVEGELLWSKNLEGGLGIGTSNYAELLALKLLLKLAADKEVRMLQVFGDSLVLIECMRGNRRMENILLRLIYDEVQAFKTLFNRITFHHVYKERNCEADSLSKAGLHLAPGLWQVQEQKENHATEYHQTAFF
eukprot:Gb_28741 [translate_table: standard]